MLRNTRTSLGFLDARFAPLSHTHEYLPLAGGTLSGSLSGVTQLTVDNVRLDGNTISTTDTNGDLLLTPNGAGRVMPNGASFYLRTNGSAVTELFIGRHDVGAQTYAMATIGMKSGGTNNQQGCMVFYTKPGEYFNNPLVEAGRFDFSGNFVLGTDGSGAKILKLNSGAAGKYLEASTDASGVGFLKAVGGGSLQLYSGLWVGLYAGNSQAMYFTAGGLFTFRDGDSANATRVTIDSANGNTNIGGTLIVGNLPTTNPGVAGQLWSEGGTVKVSAGA